MRRRQIAQQQQADLAAKIALESSQRRACPTCGAALGRDSRPPVEGTHGDSRRSGGKNPRGYKSRV